MQAKLLISVRHALGLEIKLVDRLLLCPVIKKELLKPCPIGVFRFCGLTSELHIVILMFHATRENYGRYVPNRCNSRSEFQ